MVLQTAVPRWVDVVLEGGALTLEQALVDYRALTRLLRKEWRPHGVEVSALARRVLERELEVNDAEARAMRRAAVDAEFSEGAPLLAGVREARRQLLLALRARPEHFAHALLVLEAEAEEASLLVRAWRRFQLERSVVTGLTATVGLAAPVSSYLVAREEGPVTLDWAGLLDSPEPVAALAAGCAVAGLAQARAVSWEWLGVGAARPLLSGALALVVLVACLRVPALEFGPMGLCAYLATVVMLWLSLHEWWEVKPPPQPDATIAAK